MSSSRVDVMSNSMSLVRDKSTLGMTSFDRGRNPKVPISSGILDEAQKSACKTANDCDCCLGCS